jgi:Spy/CpxP family protein refolding chaperone
MRIWILIFSAALFAGGTCLGVALQPKLAPPAPVVKIDPPTPAPPSGSDRHRSEFSVHRFASALGLGSEQDQKLDEILGDTHEEMQALGRAMRSAQDRSRERIVEILTPEQKQKLDELMSAERKKRSEEELDRTAASYKKILGLTDEQALQFRLVLAEGRKQRRDSYKPGGDWRTARKESRDKQNKEVEKVLSPEQFKRYIDVSELERFDR